MRAIRVHGVGASSMLRMEEVPTPVPADDQILIRAAAIGLNRADVGRRIAATQSAPPEPVIPGLDVAGTVEGVGSRVTGWSRGDRVMALARGTYAEHVLATPVLVCRVPERMALPEAASIPCVFLTAWYGLTKLAQMRSGETVVVHAAGSGVGIAGIQIARALGARVIATAGSEAKLEKARGLGAVAGVNYTTQDVAAELLRLSAGKGVDVVLDSVGGDVFDATLRALAPDGRVVTVGSPAGPRSTPDQRVLEAKRQRVQAIGVFNEATADMEGRGWAQLVQGFKDGTLKPVIDRILPWTQAEAAQRLLLDRAVFGKVVMTVN